MQDELQAALDILDDYQLDEFHNSTTDLTSRLVISETDSLLARCEQVVKQYEKSERPTVRIIHHFACSGGTLISKCIAALPCVYLLSELHPLTRLGIDFDRPSYTPRDLITQAHYGRVPDIDPLAEQVFIDDVKNTEKHVRQYGGKLVIRAHSHADFCVDGTPQTETVSRILSRIFQINNLVTVRNPIDSFLSLRERGWVHFTPDSFNEYCQRLSTFLDGFNKSEIVKYENFVTEPKKVLSHCANILGLEYNEEVFEFYDIFKLSGDSGRKSKNIQLRERKQITDSYRSEIESSEAFDYLVNKYGFNRI